MAPYSKKLHVQKAGAVTDINLYTTLNETGNSALAIKDGETTVYAKLGAATDALASPLRVRKNGGTHAVLKTAVKPGITPLFAFTMGEYIDYNLTVAALHGDRTLSSDTYSYKTNVVTPATSGYRYVVSFLHADGEGRIVLSTVNFNTSQIIKPHSSWSLDSEVYCDARVSTAAITNPQGSDFSGTYYIVSSDTIKLMDYDASRQYNKYFVKMTYKNIKYVTDIFDST